MITLKNIPKDTKVIALDLGGVIFNNDPGEKAYQKIAHKLSINAKDITLKLDINFENYYRGKISEKQFWQPLTSRYPITLQLCEDYYRQSVMTIPSMFAFLKKISKKYDCYALNNEPKEWMDYRIKHFKLQKYFKAFISSGYIGFCKPDIRIFKALLQMTKLHPFEILFIDDCWEHIIKARKIGFKTFLFKCPKN